MTERLKQIWAGFEGRTTRHLTDRGVDNIIVPARADWRAEETAAQEEIDGPASAAFSALKARLSTRAGKTHKRARGREAEAADAPDFAMAAETEAARDLIRGLRATELRTVRPHFNYEDALSGADRRKLFKGAKRKKFLGLF